jgi:hypothetical protein
MNPARIVTPGSRSVRSRTRKAWGALRHARASSSPVLLGAVPGVLDLAEEPAPSGGWSTSAHECQDDAAPGAPAASAKFGRHPTSSASSGRGGASPPSRRRSAWSLGSTPGRSASPASRPSSPRRQPRGNTRPRRPRAAGRIVRLLHVVRPDRAGDRARRRRPRAALPSSDLAPTSSSGPKLSTGYTHIKLKTGAITLCVWVGTLPAR